MGDLSVTFWGVRGSIPTPGADHHEFGGNTSCLEVRAGGQTFILDAGTGIRGCGQKLFAEAPVDVVLFISHYHWDHIQGLPFFGPAFAPGNRIRIMGAPDEGGRSVQELLAGQMTSPYFPVTLTEFKADISYHDPSEGDLLSFGDVEVRTLRVNHPGGCTSYAFLVDGHKFVYATDHEHGTAKDDELIEHARDADILVFDTAFTPDEYDGTVGFSRKGWGHSTWVEAVRIARAAAAKRLVLFHHDPPHDDAFMRDLERRVAEEFPETVAAREGMTLSP